MISFFSKKYIKKHKIRPFLFVDKINFFKKLNYKVVTRKLPYNVNKMDKLFFDYLPILKKKKNLYLKKKEKDSKIDKWFLDFLSNKEKEKNTLTSKQYSSFKSNIVFLKHKNMPLQNLSIIRGKEVIFFLKRKKNLCLKFNVFTEINNLEFNPKSKRNKYVASRYNPSFRLFCDKYKFKFLSKFMKKKLLSADKLKNFYLNIRQNNRIFFLLKKSKKYLYNYGPTLRFAKKFVGRRVRVKN